MVKVKFCDLVQPLVHMKFVDFEFFFFVLKIAVLNWMKTMC